MPKTQNIKILRTQIAIGKATEPSIKNKELAKLFDVSEGCISNTLKNSQKWEELQDLIREYSLNDVFNCDETGLYWKIEPKRTISNKPVSGRKQSKDWVTILLCSNATGTEKLKPAFIHKYKNPRPLKNLPKLSLSVEYYWNVKAWMQVSIWNDWIRQLDATMRLKERKILLLVDNAPVHALYEGVKLTNIEIKFLPPNTTAHLQPCDKGIINSFKVNNSKNFNAII
ncbi:tigger transposable element-derived protein 6-like [Rhizophagus clarus]|uniref:Tigger transposable element-derived protein 6-like n=1 Tax=Rhizophagus clarus TaxID=94130 RepID=A0A8H3LZ23_9GLOM|nr:tigger transposable element-derived protein 6-like [Rhizophagus clarus]